MDRSRLVLGVVLFSTKIKEEGNKRRTSPLGRSDKGVGASLDKSESKNLTKKNPKKNNKKKQLIPDDETFKGWPQTGLRCYYDRLILLLLFLFFFRFLFTVVVVVVAFHVHPLVGLFIGFHEARERH